MKVLPIGSVIQRNGKKAMITGYHQVEKNGYYEYEYLLAAYPYGCMKKESLGTYPIKAETEILFTGYVNERGAKYIDILDRLTDNLTKADARTFDLFGRILAKYMKEMEGSL